MSVKLRAFLAEQSKLRGSAKAVLLEIAHFADDAGKGVYTAVPTLARRIGRTERTVQRALNEARIAGELAIYYNRGPNGTNHYRIRLENFRPEIDARKSAGVTNEKMSPHQNVTGDKLTDKGSVFSGSLYSSGSCYGPEALSGPKLSSRPRRLRQKQDPVDHERRGEWMSDEELCASFDAAMRDSLEAGKLGPAEVASEAALRAAYANWTPYKVILKDGTEWGRGEIPRPRYDPATLLGQGEAPNAGG